MSWDVFLRATDQITAFPQAPKTVSLSNHGEPLCNPLLPKMVAYIKSLGTSARTSMHTNASLLDEKTADALVAAGLDRVVVSLQGMSAAEYQKACGVKLDYDRFFRRLRYFYEIKTTTEVCVKIVDVALQRPDEDFYAMFSQVADRVFIEKAVPIWGAEEVAGDVANKYGETFQTIRCCPLVFHTLVVTAEGGILPCTRLNPPVSLRTIFETTLLKAWNSPRRVNFLKKMLIQGRHACAACKECYIAQNSIYGHEDIIDDHWNLILERLTGNETALDG